MLKINCLLLTVTISFFSLFLFNTESAISFKKNTPIHEIKIDSSINTCAISIDNSYEELAHFDEQNVQNKLNHFQTFQPLSSILTANNSNYLKVCDFLNLNLTIDKIVFPFHTFL